MAILSWPPLTVEMLELFIMKVHSYAWLQWACCAQLLALGFYGPSMLALLLNSFWPHKLARCSATTAQACP